MEEEADIGLSRLSRRSGSSTSSPPQKRLGHGRRPSTITIVEDTFAIGNVLSPIRSPSSPNLLLKDLPPPSPRTPRKLSRSNTLPRLQSSNIDEWDSLSMEYGKILKLRRWIQALVLVNFDLEYGPKITRTFPPISLSPAESENIAFSSFPDAPQVELGSQMHSFRVRPHDPTEDKLVRPDEDRPVTQDGFLYGYSYFTQRRDSTSKRGYQQSSLVILTQYALPSLFYTLLSYLGQAFLLHGTPILEVACHNIASWLDPVSGSHLELGFLGFVFNVELPSSTDTPQSAVLISVKEYDQDTKIFASLSPPHPALISIFEACLQHMWSIWECLVLCEPIMVYGTSASMTSQAVWFLRDILRPIPLTGDFRPFFTIHDADHSVFINPRPPQPGVLIGVTNPIIERTCKHWPHIVSLGAPQKKEKLLPATPKTPRTPWTPADSPMTAGPAPGWRSKISKRYISRDRVLLKRLEDACRGDERSKLEASHALRQHFSARTTALLVPLQRYLNTLIPTPAEAALGTPTPSTRNFSHLPSSSRVPSANPSPVPQHSRSSFLSAHSTPNSSADPSPVSSHPPSPLPLSRAGSGAPSPAPSPSPTPSPALSTPQHPPTTTRLKPFSTSAFLASLSASHAVTTLPFKSSSKQKEFYERWVRTRAFGVWLGQQEEVVRKVLEERSMVATS